MDDVQGYKKISSATEVESLEQDFRLIGWRGQSTDVAPLICLSSQMLRQYISTQIQQAVANPVAYAASVAPEPTVAMSVEEFFDEMSDQYKDCYLQLFNDGSTISVKNQINLDPVSLSLSVSDNNVIVRTSVKCADLNISTIQVTFASAGEVPAFSPYILAEEYLSVVAPKQSGYINITFKAPLIAEGTQLSMSVE